MAITIKYKDLVKRLIKEMTIEQLGAVKVQLHTDFKALPHETVQERRVKEELMAQMGLISGIINEKSKLIEHKCEKCGNTTDFAPNMCEKCFDEETDRYYDGGLDEDE